MQQKFKRRTIGKHGIYMWCWGLIRFQWGRYYCYCYLHSVGLECRNSWILQNNDSVKIQEKTCLVFQLPSQGCEEAQKVVRSSRRNVYYHMCSTVTEVCSLKQVHLVLRIFNGNHQHLLFLCTHSSSPCRCQVARVCHQTPTTSVIISKACIEWPNTGIQRELWPSSSCLIPKPCIDSVLIWANYEYMRHVDLISYSNDFAIRQNPEPKYSAVLNPAKQKLCLLLSSFFFLQS